MLKNENEKRYKVRMGFDHVLYSFLYSKAWRKLWERRQYKKNSNYYLIMAIAKLFEKLDNYKFNEFDLYCIGHSHLDACWLWTKLSTIRRAIVTFQQNIEQFERYPYYTFSQTTPQYYDWVRRLRPALFQKVQQYEKQGRWEIIGGMWVEPDLNLPNGESLVRQRLYGQLFYLEHFGKLAKIESIEDTFGYNAQLPQILVKSGAEIFWTAKITWNNLTEFPFANFLWRGIDGSEIFTHSYKCNWNVLLSLSLYKRSGRKIKEPGLVFNSSIEKEVIESHLSDERVKTCGMFYGFGDGGMGPLKEETELLENMVMGGLIKFSTFEKYFKLLRKECGIVLPIWNDELYLETHRGVFTSQANTKRLNRALEIDLRNWEILLSISSIVFDNYSYPNEEIEKSWKILLFNQFHDILPGSSIQDVYYEQEKEMEDLDQRIKNSISLTLQSLLRMYLKNQGLLKEDNKIKHAIIFNPLPWTRDGFLESIRIKNIPPLSFRIIDFNELNTSSKKKDLKIIDLPDRISLENSVLTVTISKLTGKVVSIIKKDSNKELVKPSKGIGIHVYKEKRHKRPAWDIYRGYTSNRLNLGKINTLQIAEDTDEIKSVKFTIEFNKTIIQQRISLKRNSEIIEFKTDINTFDRNLMFKVRFPLNLQADYLTAEIPYGNLKRKIVPEAHYEIGKWEFPAQKYVDVSESQVGVTILNNSKYGFSSNKQGIYLTLLRTPARASSSFFSHLDLVPKKERTKYVDFGQNSIDYALWVHEGDFVKSAAWKKGYEYNYPLLYEKYDDEQAEHDTLTDIPVKDIFIDIIKNESSFISIANPNIILHTIKAPEKLILKREAGSIQQEENNTLLILRMFETSGTPQEGVKIELNKALTLINVAETDLLERELSEQDRSPIVINNNKEIVLDFNKFEIKTMKLSLSNN